MPSSIPAIAFCAGLALIIVALLGGGIEVKEVKVPPLPLFPRAGDLHFRLRFGGCGPIRHQSVYSV